MRKRRRHSSESSEELAGEFEIDDKPSILNKIIFTLLPVMMIIATLAYGSTETWGLGIQVIFIGLILVLWLADSFFKKQLRISTNILQLPLLGVTLIGFIQLLPFRNLGFSNELLPIAPSSALSLNPNITRLAVVQFCIYVIFFAAALTFVNTQKRVQKIVFIIISFGGFMAFLGIIQSLSGSESIYGLRVTPNAFPFASFVNRHHFAAFMEMTIGLTLSLLYGNSTKKDKRLLLIIAVVLMGIGLVLTSSRGGILSLLGVISLVTFLNIVYKNDDFDFESSPSATKSYAKYIFIGSSIALVLALLGSVLLLGRDGNLTRGLGMSEMTDVSNGRTHFWQTALQIIANNPVIGAGLDAFGVAFTRYDTWNGTMRVEQAHNDYLQIFADAGILGFSCVIAFIFLLFRKATKLLKQTSDRFGRGVIIGALAGCFGIMLHSFVDFPLRTPSNSLFFLMSATLATTAIAYSQQIYRR